MVHRFLLPLREQLRLVQPVEAPQTPVQDVSAKEAIWLFVRNPADLDETEQGTLTAMCQASETARTIYQLVQEFRQLLHHRQGEKLDDWLEKVRLGRLREFLVQRPLSMQGDGVAIEPPIRFHASMAYRSDRPKYLQG